MASNTFGTLFKITTWGESHGKALGVVIDGCPAGLSLCEEEINAALSRRAPGRNPYTSPRKEADRVEILSGLFEGKTTGAPLCLFIANTDVDSSPYEPLKDVLKPGHAHYTYLAKYGLFDHRGGGRASARETVCRVAAGAVARKFLTLQGVEILASLAQVGGVKVDHNVSLHAKRDQVQSSRLWCSDPCAEALMVQLLDEVKEAGDSVGGVVEFCTSPLPVGWGEPVYEKLEAKLASALMSLPASKGFEIGEGFGCVDFRGSVHNDPFCLEEEVVRTASNHAGGTLGGISTGMPLRGRVAFKPPSSIKLPQRTLSTTGESAVFEQRAGSRHDPCVAIRAVPVVEAMVALVLVDVCLMNRCARL